MTLVIQEQISKNNNFMPCSLLEDKHCSIHKIKMFLLNIIYGDKNIEKKIIYFGSFVFSNIHLTKASQKLR